MNLAIPPILEQALARGRRRWRLVVAAVREARPPRAWKEARAQEDARAGRSLPAAVRAPLQKISAQSSRVAATEGLCAAIIFLAAALAASCWIDWLANLSQPLRILSFAIQIAVTLLLLWFGVFDALRIAMPLRVAALRLQKANPVLRSSVVSAVELLTTWGHSFAGDSGMLRRLETDVTGSLRKVDLGGVVSKARLRRLQKWAAVAVVANAIWIAIFWPRSAVMVGRWAGSPQPLPTFTVVRDVAGAATIARGTDLALTARAEGVVPETGRVQLVFENGDKQNIPASRTSADTFAATVPNVQSGFRFVCHLNDGRSETLEVKVIEPPGLVGFEMEETLPAYTGLPSRKHAAGNLAFLQGGTLNVSVKASQPLQGASIVLAGLEETIPLKVGSDPATAQGTFSVTQTGLTGLSFRLVNAEGVSSMAETVFVARVIPDAPPTLRLLSPEATEETITPEGRLPLIYEVEDDFGLGALAIVYTIESGPQGGGGAGEEKRIVLPVEAPPGPRQFLWKLPTVEGIAPGVRLRWKIEARDRNDVTGPGVSTTDERTLEIVTPEQKVAEIFERAREASDAIRRLSDEQLRLKQELREQAPAK